MLWVQINDWLWETANYAMGGRPGIDFGRVWADLDGVWHSSGDTYSYSCVEEAREAAERVLR